MNFVYSQGKKLVINKYSPIKCIKPIAPSQPAPLPHALNLHESHKSSLPKHASKESKTVDY